MLSARILLRDEVAVVLKDLRRRSRRSINARRNLIVFRLACCCGLRCCEIAGLNLDDVCVDGPKPLIRVRRAITKGESAKRMARDVPLWWDAGTLADIATWKAYRLATGAALDSPFICGVLQESLGARRDRRSLFKYWRTAIAALGIERVRQLSIHKGRHSFCSHALDAGHSLVEVRDAAGHSSANMTSKYLHLLPREHCADIFGERLTPKTEILKHGQATG